MAGQSIFKAFGWINPNNLHFTKKFTYVNFNISCVGLRDDIKSLAQQIPEKPKRPLTAYFKFLTEKRPALVKTNPSLSNIEIIKTLSQQWSQLNAKEKETYILAALEEKEIYDEKLFKYNAQLTPEHEKILKEIKVEKQKDKIKRKVKLENKAEGKPKKPVTAFAIFLKENFVQGKSVVDSMRDITEKWTKLPESEKQKYQMQWQKNKEKYDADLVSWENRMIAKGKSFLVRDSLLKSKSKIKTKSKEKSRKTE
ncbi:transcription factor A, mitochondrial-like [Euwallacea fornicatus]|uniref:transcription factor A, mitochondrial-like n=1 Tax=Euwallacea fornicatus TaxID=995702 RepID=UPI00339066EA